jgi:hypothetical protein
MSTIKAFGGDADGRRQRVAVELSADEALVLFDWLERKSPPGQPPPFEDKAEQIVLWDLCCLLESVLVEPFDANYAEQVGAARAAVPGEDSDPGHPPAPAG